MLFYKWIFNLQIHYNWRLAFTLPQLANTIQAATNSTTAISWVLFFNWFFNHQAQQHNGLHSSCCHDFGNYDWLLNFQPAFTNHFPLVVHPANSPYLTSSIHTATTSKHNSCCHNFYDCHWSLILQPANNARYTTAIHSQCCFSYSICSARPPISVHVAFPIATMFNFRHCHWQRDTQLFPHFMLHFPLPLSYYNCH